MTNFNGANIILSNDFKGVVIGKSNEVQSNGAFYVAILENNMFVHFDNADIQQGVVSEILENNEMPESVTDFLDMLSASLISNHLTSYVQSVIV